jgi:hypothetical protein
MQQVSEADDDIVLEGLVDGIGSNVRTAALLEQIEEHFDVAAAEILAHAHELAQREDARFLED